MGREDPQLKLRLTEELKEKVADAAKANNRSVNAEIVARLEMSQNIERFLSDFELAKERILSAQRIEAALKQQVEILKEALDMERATNERLLLILADRLGSGPMPEQEKE
ncbi:Arc family DNA-binding protein [Sinorhizobium meliloti]|uniref:Arc family DNA-binding protein n=1 Tax=Rhizobium meliloti TaxID=382 RepID=UPI000FDCB898|nr:Arc family DNA-binding protein [Sinorhizobium meliloti]RVI06472.1 Arc family DNA-binding protein [Sinorhizobium meliloti]